MLHLKIIYVFPPTIYHIVLNESNNSNTSNHAADELTLSSNNSDDILNHLNSMQLDMNQYINQNYENQEDFDAINGMS